MRHSSSQFWLSLPAPENSQNFAIGFIGSKTQLSAQRGARSNSQSSLCALGQPHTSGLWPLSWCFSAPVLPALMRSVWGITEPWMEPTKFLQPTCPGTLYFWHLHGKSQNAQIHKLKQSPPFLWGKKTQKPTINASIFAYLFSFSLVWILFAKVSKVSVPLQIFQHSQSAPTAARLAVHEGKQTEQKA